MIDLFGKTSPEGDCEKYRGALAASHGGANTAGDTSRTMVVRSEQTRMICLIGSELRRVGAPLQNAMSRPQGVSEEQIPFSKLTPFGCIATGEWFETLATPATC